MPLAARPHFTSTHQQSHKSSPSTKRYGRNSTTPPFKAISPPSATISTDEIGFKIGPSTSNLINANRQIIKDKGPCARVELQISARNLADRDFFSKSDPICIVEELASRYLRKNSKNEFVELGRTECIKNTLDPVWNNRITLNYYFESKQMLRFKIYDIDSGSSKLSEHDFLGKSECELADIVAAPNGIYEMKVFSCKDVPRQGGILLVCAEELDEGQRDIAYFSVRGVDLNSGGSFLRKCILNPNSFLEFFRLCDGSRHLINRTEIVKNSKNPEWKPFELRINQICKGDKEKEFLIECYDQREATGNHHLIGSALTSVSALASNQRKQIELTKKKINKGESKTVVRGFLHFMDVQVRKEFTFLDFIASGLQLEFAVAVDLTASNGEISKTSSLHYVNSQYLNQYECAICAVLEICEHYNHSKLFESIGFGAKIPPAFSVSHMFPLRLNNFERFVEGIQGVLDAYRYAVVNTQLYGPTNFAPTIREFVYKCQQFPRDGTKYQVLLMLTDGIITDMQSTIEALIDASHEPLSIIIIGIGKEDFKKMEFLDSDNRLLTYNGKVAARDIVQFVPFREFIGSAFGITAEEQSILKTLLAREVLAELPAQVCSFMKANSIVPLRPRATSDCDINKLFNYKLQQSQITSKINCLTPSTKIEQQKSIISNSFEKSEGPPYPEF